MDSKKIFYLLALLLLHTSAVNAHVESINKNRAVENSSIKVRGENLQGATACFEFPTSSITKASCRELNIKSNSKGNITNE